MAAIFSEARPDFIFYQIGRRGFLSCQTDRREFVRYFVKFCRIIESSRRCRFFLSVSPAAPLLSSFIKGSLPGDMACFPLSHRPPCLCRPWRIDFFAVDHHIPSHFVVILRSRLNQRIMISLLLRGENRLCSKSAVPL